MWQTLKDWATRLKRETVAIWFACRDPRTHWLVKLFAVLIVAYALSPIDLIPDFIPVLGYVDDLILLPAAIWLIVKMIPAPVLSECREKAHAWIAAGSAEPRSRLGAVIVVVIWVVLAWWVISIFSAALSAA